MNKKIIYVSIIATLFILLLTNGVLAVDDTENCTIGAPCNCRTDAYTLGSCWAIMFGDCNLSYTYDWCNTTGVFGYCCDPLEVPEPADCPEPCFCSNQAYRDGGCGEAGYDNCTTTSTLCEFNESHLGWCCQQATNGSGTNTTTINLTGNCCGPDCCIIIALALLTFIFLALSLKSKSSYLQKAFLILTLTWILVILYIMYLAAAYWDYVYAPSLLAIFIGFVSITVVVMAVSIIEMIKEAIAGHGY